MVADLHVHSKYSRACSRDCDLEHLAWWARRKGVAVVGTGDFTHPAWYAALTEQLVEAEPGLYRLRPELERAVDQKLAPSCRGTTRFMLSVEISTIYKRDGATRKVHHLVYLPDLAAVGRFNAALGRIGNLGSDGRPILGLDSRDLLEITLEASPDGYLVPAHVWTPWFAALGSKSGFDAIADCYADLADHIFAIETGLSSDPPMNWRVSALDRYALVSNSDAHSPPALGREATMFATPYDFFAIRDALRTRDGLAGTVEFFPEEGKYHLDGHRKCAVRLEPEQTRKLDGRCPTCDKPLTVGVLHRVEALADRPDGHRPERAAPFRNLVPLPEILGEIHGVGPKSKTVDGKVVALVAELGSELSILTEVPIDEVTRAGGAELGEAVARLRRGEVCREGGYDGEYGTVKLFEPGELADRSAGALFDLAPDPNAAPRKRPAGSTRARSVPRQRAVPAQDELLAADGTAPPEALAGLDHVEPVITGMERLGTGLLDLLDPDQKAAAQVTDGPVLIIAGPGTGKTRTLIQRLGHLIAECGVPAERCLAITFTRRAADEMGERLRFLLAAAQPEQRDAATGAGATVSTFHALGLSIVREHADRFGLTAGFRIADADEQLDAVGEAAGLPDDETAQARRLLRQLQEFRRTAGRLRADAPGEAAAGRPDPATADTARPEPADDLTDLVKDYTAALRARDLVDLDELVRLPVQLLGKEPALVAAYRQRYTHVFVDEYQDVDDTQYGLLRLLCPPDGNLCAIGDPDQSIYSFRGAEVGYFLRFAADFPTATVVRLTRNYRSTAPILAAAVQAIAPDTLVAGRSLAPARRGAINGARITRYSASSPADEADFVARTIDALVGGSSFHALDSGRVDSREHGPLGGVSFADIAVLYRTDAQAGPIIDALSRSGVPVQKRSHDRLLDRPGVAAIVDELRYATGIDGAIAARVRLTAQVLVGRGDLPDPQLTDADIHTAVELLMPLAARCGADLETFLAELATGAEVDTWDPRADRVTLLTLHASKGLEFPVVFLVGCEDGLLPHRLPGRPPTDEQLAEERRLLFVGITRAKDRLYLSHAARRQRRGDTEPRPVAASPFLAAIDHRLYDRLGDDPEPAKPQARQLRLI
ncbi:UvrD-helicase domain-containing protein [Actinocatenispora sera]|uniref:UvrD-helicase domain-containing protein n=1 Tax=Actinocatenispora sera TaxID=390989 RepID=UPI0004C35221|nr:UvrD-helicase domain-containing protein [Actinocatenispora sera]